MALTVVVELPAAIDDVNALLAVIADRWPNARVNTKDAGGWRIVLAAIDEDQ